MAPTRLQDPDSSQRARGRAVLLGAGCRCPVWGGAVPLEKASHLGLRLRRDPTANTPRVESLVAVCTCVRALFSPEEEARPSLQLTLVSPVLETPAVACHHPQQFPERPRREDPSPVHAFLISCLQRRWGAGWRLSWGLSSRGPVLAIRWGQDPPELGRGQGKTQGRVPAHLLLPVPGRGRGLGAHRAGTATPCARDAWLVPVALCDHQW